MKYEQQILAHGTKYVGYLLKNDELVYSTEEMDTPQQASKQLSQYFLTPNKPKSTKTFIKSASMSTMNPNLPKRSCCGRN